MLFSFNNILRAIKNDNKIILKNNDILSYGHKRVCYKHNHKPSMIIKISRNPEQWKIGHMQSLTEWYVSKRVNAISGDCQISLCHQWVMTNKGLGLVVDKISNNKGESLTLRNLLFANEITVNKAVELVEKIIQNFALFGIPASDFNIDNFILDDTHDEYRIVMVDGFSPKKTNFKAYLLLKNKTLANLYTKRKWRLIKNKFTYCAQAVYAGNYNFSAAPPLHAS